MRLSAYKKALEEANKLPDEIPTLKAYFNKSYSPREIAMNYVLTMARRDDDALFDGEFVELYLVRSNLLSKLFKSTT